MNILVNIPDPNDYEAFLNFLNAISVTAEVRPVIVSTDGRVAYLDRIQETVDEHLSEFDDSLPKWDQLSTKVQTDFAEMVADMPEWHFPEQEPPDLEYLTYLLNRIRSENI